MSSTENSYKNLIVEGLKQALALEPESTEIKEYLQENGIVLDSLDSLDGPKIEWLFFIMVINFEYLGDYQLKFIYKSYLKALFSLYKDGYFFKKCGSSFSLNSNQILFSMANPPFVLGEEIKDEVEQDKVGLAALGSVASYSKTADPNKDSQDLTAEEMALFDAADLAFRRAFITMPQDAYYGDMAKDEELAYQSLKDKKDFTVVPMNVGGCGFALLIHGSLPTQSGKVHEYYVIAIRGTAPILLDKTKILNNSHIGAEQWVYQLYNYPGRETDDFKSGVSMYFRNYVPFNLNPH